MNNFEMFWVDPSAGPFEVDITPRFYKTSDGVNAVFTCGESRSLFNLNIKTDNPDIYFNYKDNEWISDFVNNILLSPNDNKYVTNFDSFGVRDLKFIIPDGNQEIEIYMTTDVEITQLARTIVFENFEVFNKSSDVEILSCKVTPTGFNFEIQEQNALIYKNKLDFANSLQGLDRIKVYQSDLYKNGCRDFDKFVKELLLWQVVGGIKNESADFTKTKLISHRHAFYTNKNQLYSLIMFEEKNTLYFDLYKSILDNVTKSAFLTKNMKSDLEHILNRWFMEKFSTKKSMMKELIKLDNAMHIYIQVCYTIRRYAVNCDLY
jgi:hypothetical protein